ncbi:bifunctional tRNA (5-methylaminomethyl-2-thiouridine)(34)-methyltransferase MnmD/FAD-dependent 5-carboxymethylaminomethyl-2-thiouridine(34) oxidoreductase MnmC [Thiomicrospira sp. XS5]|uniref:bifunctional tRNA (5-methylaminomethyl-2-thiouridine)(34)-methyltransferase MnmD/FAD-dependent 5-carboxymethylaminomethyl-2-thiouridine(34) oxidoreductase MnmC n=1 Tax=Thiomicrospira sp. XS5 TaxID=1775636 RepID=UPI000A6ED270|nr:bifunctional tRNA (5-methylaminomethyl-2-thiouridine)(34)-methyltransferase MnmD/FAD-dependent 5-carboxymethylaminomethyl-2-thiouridine(34) oxidoreductase MnmC [Thiomicrospira sp. XS5]
MTSANIEWTPEQVPKAVDFDDIYYSLRSGLVEADYVFVQQNRLPERFAALPPKTVFTVAETGFGTGLNFLQTLRSWFENAPKSSELRFISFEKFPLSVEDLKKAHSAFDELGTLSQALRDAYPLRLPGWHEVLLFDGKVRLIVWFGDVLQGLAEFDCLVDAWFLDGFTPSKNPDMWQPNVYTNMARLSHAETTFATFTVAGEVRRGLQKAGFEVEKAPGFEFKREMCHGRLAQVRSFASKAPWFRMPDSIVASERRAIVVGAGLAGATVARQLAQQGWSVQVVEAAAQPAQQASGNLAGAIHPLVTADWNLRSQFYLRGFETTLKWLEPWLAAHEIVGELNGLMQLAVTDTIDTRLRESLKRVGLPPEFAVWCNAEQAGEHIGQATPFEGMFFPQGGWVRPSTVVEQCLAHDAIELRLSETVVDFTQNGQAWSVLTDKAQLEADVLVVATGALDERLNRKLGLPVRRVKGQVTHLSASEFQTPLHCTVTHRGYTVNGAFGGDAPYTAVTGATFEGADSSVELSETAQADNRAMVTEALPDWLAGETGLHGNIGFRPAVADHLPLVGAVPNPEWMRQAYLTEPRTKALHTYSPQRYQTGLFVSNGHGARGLMSVFLSAEIIGRMVSGEMAVMSKNLYHAVHPSRFDIRSWRSGKKSY